MTDQKPAAIQLWFARFSRLERPQWLAQSARLLNSAELERVATILDPDTRAQHAVGRALMRLLGAREAGCTPSELAIAVTDGGKPWLPGVPDLNITVAHTRRAVVVASMSGAPIGVDIEHPEAAVQPLRLAQRLFASEEVRAVRELSGEARADWFARIWTIKEAVAKALGVGVIPALSRVVVESADAGPRLADVGFGPAAGSWTLHQLVAPGGSEKVAVAVPAPSVALSPLSQLTLGDFARAVSAQENAQGATERTCSESTPRRARA